MKQLQLTNDALNCISEIIQHHEKMDSYECLQVGLPLKEEIGNFKEIKQKIESDYQHFLEIINYLISVKQVPVSQLHDYGDVL